MPTVSAFKQLTLAEVAKRMDPDGDAAMVAEVLEQDNSIIQDMPMLEANGPFHNVSTKRLSLPGGTWRRLNAGVPSEASQTVQVTDTMGMLETFSIIDQKVAELHPGGVVEARRLEDTAFLIGLAQSAAKAVVYASLAADPGQFDGLDPRVASKTAGNAVDGGGSGSDVSSIWVVQWGPTRVHGIYPKNSKAGIDRNDLGLREAQDADGGHFMTYKTHFRFHLGLVVKDDRCVQRICNVETAVEDYGALKLDNLLIQALNRMPSEGSGAVIYCNKTIRTHMDILLKDKSNVNFSMSDAWGAPVMTFRGVPVRVCDAILDTEPALD